MRAATKGFRRVRFRDLKKDDFKYRYNLGFRVLGCNIDYEATDDDIKRVRDIYRENDLEVGECHIQGSSDIGGLAAMMVPDPNLWVKHKQHIRKGIEICGKLGVAHIQLPIGSMNPTNVYFHHRENHTQKAMDLLVKCAQEIAPIAEDNQCLICPETNLWTIVNNIPRMMEYVDRVNNPFMLITCDFNNQMSPERIYVSGQYIRCGVVTLGDRIGCLHVKDVYVEDDKLNICHINETYCGNGVLDQKALLEASKKLQPWKLANFEHMGDKDLPKAVEYMNRLMNEIGFKWDDHHCTRERWEKGLCK